MAVLTMTDRDRLRSLQDKIIALAERRGYDEYMRVSRDMPDNITLGALRTMIYPAYESELCRVLLTLKAK